MNKSTVGLTMAEEASCNTGYS